MIITDSHYLIGKSHLTCDDYAINGQTYSDSSFIAISDGCSSSPKSELGSRLLSIAFINLINLPLITKNYEYNSFGLYLSKRSESYSSILGLENSCLDATLIGAFHIEDKNIWTTKAFIYGDGIIFYKLKNEKDIKFYSVSFVKEVPYYLSYLTQPERNECYKKFSEEFCGKTKIIVTGSLGDEELITRYENYDSEVYLSFSDKSLEFIGVSSDGLSSFVKKNLNSTIEKIDLKNILKEIINFDSINKSFVKRKLKRIKDIYSKEEIYNTDDISLSIMYFKD